MMGTASIRLVMTDKTLAQQIRTISDYSNNRDKAGKRMKLTGK